MTNFYEFEANDIKEKAVKMSKYAGNLVLVVNVASRCGFTPQYEGLEKLYQEHKDKGLVILAFPCNQFGGQEPGDAAEIMSFCKLNYGVTFPIFSKIKVNGKEAQPLYNYLKTELPDTLGGRIKWNFTKFLVDRTGKPIKRFAPNETPDKIGKYIAKII